MNRRVMLALLALLGSASSALAAEPVYRFHKPVDRVKAEGEGILAIVLDADVYEATRPGFPDLRIVDEAGHEVPYVLEQSSRSHTRTMREPCASEVVSLREREDHRLEIVVRLKEKAPDATGLTIVSPLKDYEHPVRVLGSAGEENWLPLVESALVFDYSRYMDVRNRDIRLPANHARQFRIEIRQGLEERESPFMGLVKDQQAGAKERRVEFRELLRRPFRIDRVEAWRTVERPGEVEPDKTTYRVSLDRTEHDSREKLTRLEISPGREPLTRFTLQTTSRNFSRPMRVEAATGELSGGGWREVGRGTIHRYQLGDFLDEKLDVEFSETRSASYRLVIEDGDSPPLNVTSVEAQANIYRLIFLGSGGSTYRLLYGSVDAKPPHYDAAPVLASLGPGREAVRLGLGAEVIDHSAPPSRGLSDLLNSKFALMLALALMVVVLAWVLLRAGKEIAKLPGAEE